MADQRITTVDYFVYEDAAAFARYGAETIANQIIDAVSARGVARVAFSGGNTPRPVFQLLANKPYQTSVPWGQVQIYWVDERSVAPDKPESNYGMTKASLLDHVSIPAENVFRMEGERDPEEAAARYESTIRNELRLEGAELPTFDLVTLGMGDDGHTASLFPHTEGLQEFGRIAIANRVPQKDTWRLTLTSPVLNQARQVVFMIQGADKADVLARVFLGGYDPETFPSQLIRPKTGKITLILDKAAASKLPTPAGAMGRIEVRR